MSKYFPDSTSIDGMTIMIVGIIINIIVLLAFGTFMTFGSKTITKRICRSTDYADNVTLLAEKKPFMKLYLY